MSFDPAPRNHPSRPSHGVALVTALLASTVLITLLMALVSSRIVELRTIEGTVHIAQAQLIAEAGVDYIVGLAVRDDGVLPLESPCVHSAQDAFYCVSDVAYAGGSFDAWALDDGGLFSVTARAVDAHGTARNLEVQFDLALRNRIVSNFALLTCQGLTMTGGLTVQDGDVYTGGEMLVQSASAVINGDALARDAITFSGNGSVTGNVVSETGAIVGGALTKFRAGGYAANPALYTTLDLSQTGAGLNHDPFVYDMPDYCQAPVWPVELEVSSQDFSDYQAAALAEGNHLGDVAISAGGMGSYATSLHHIDGNMVIDGMPTSQAFDGTYVVTGDLTINADILGSATFVVLGNLTVQGGANITDPDTEWAFVVDGDVRIAGGSTIDGVIYTNGSVEGEGNATVNGSVITAGSGTVSGSLAVNYRNPGDEVDLPNKYLDNVDVLRWRHVF